MKKMPQTHFKITPLNFGAFLYFNFILANFDFLQCKYVFSTIIIDNTISTIIKVITGIKVIAICFSNCVFL